MNHEHSECVHHDHQHHFDVLDLLSHLLAAVLTISVNVLSNLVAYSTSPALPCSVNA